jgi:hypothetical protein
LKQFHWDTARHRQTNTSLSEIVSNIQQTVASADEELKKLSVSYSEKNQAYSALLRKKTVNLSTSDFEDFLTPEIASRVGNNDSEFITTVAVVVPLAIESGTYNILNLLWAVG